jgi:hypothetical protein
MLVESIRALDFVERIRPVTIVEALRVNEYVERHTSKRFAETIISADYLRKVFEKNIAVDTEVCDRYSRTASYHASLYEVIEARDYMCKSILRNFYEYIVARDSPYRRLIISMIDSIIDEGWIARIQAKTMYDKAKFREIINKVGFTISGYATRRVYYLPVEFKNLWDIIEDSEHNTKVAICKALLEKFKSIRDKLAG